MGAPQDDPTGSALDSWNFRLFVCGQTVSLIGTFMQSVAMGWLVFRLSQSEFTLGLVGFVGEVPGMAVALLGGVLADRANPYRIVLATQALAMLQALMLATLTLSGQIGIPAILALSCFFGLVNGFDVPARQVLVTQFVRGEAALKKAVLVNSMTLDAARLIGPALGGVAIAAFGEGLCFLANGASYAAILAALLLMRRVPVAPARAGETVARTLADGLRYAMGARPIRAILGLIAMVAFSGAAGTVLLPVMAARVLSGGPATLGILSAASGIGALAGALAMLLLQRRPPAPFVPIALGAALFGAGLVAFALSQLLALSLLCLAVAGFGVMLMMSSAHATLLAVSEPGKRGRVMSLFTLSFMSAAPIGNLASGIVAGGIGAPATIAIGGCLCMIAAAVLAWTRAGGLAQMR